VYDAVANFNIGRKASVLIFEKMNMTAGTHMINGCRELKNKRVKLSLYKNKKSTKTRRKILRGLKKQKADKDTDKEGTMYEAGAF